MPKLWLIGGTQESRQLVEQLCVQKSPTVALPHYLVSVTTEAARSLYPQSPSIQIWVGHLTLAAADKFVAQHGVIAVLDASHPFAVEISKLAIALAKRHHLAYLRYERPIVCAPETPWRDLRGRSGFLRLPKLQDVLTQQYLAAERTLLTLGYRQLPQFAPWQSQGTLWARILPSPIALQTALANGFTPDRLIALRPPLSAALETALWQQWRITQVITKASGSAGGQKQKQQIAAELGVRLIQIERPAIAYLQKTDCFDTALQFALRYRT
ncbi:MAG: cobalt-precorrin-6A reductase [Cyanobacteria bacterium P01_H01_bin.153]